MKQKEFTAKTVEQAIEDGLKEFGVSKEHAEIEILSAGGFLSKAKVLITVSESQGEKAKEFVEKVLSLMKVSAYVELEETENESILNIIGADVSPITRGSGETIDALQYLTSLVSNAEGEYRRVVLDSEDYRKQRQQKLEAEADRLAEKAIKQGYREKLKPMNAYERRVMHARLQSNDEVTTHSEGVEPVRYLVITPKKMKVSNYSYNALSGSEKQNNYSGYGHRNDRNRNDRGYKGGDRNNTRNGKDGFNGDRNRGYKGGSGFKKAETPRPAKVTLGSLITDKVESKNEETSTEE